MVRPRATPGRPSVRCLRSRRSWLLRAARGLIPMLRGVPVAHDACRKISITLKTPSKRVMACNSYLVLVTRYCHLLAISVS
jgi:hypothetical protein